MCACVEREREREREREKARARDGARERAKARERERERKRARERERESVYHYSTRTTPGAMLKCVGLTWAIDTEQTGAAPFLGPAVQARVPSDTPQDSLRSAAPGTGGGRRSKGAAHAPTGSFAPLPTNACTHTHPRQCGVGQAPARGCPVRWLNYHRRWLSEAVFALQGARTAPARLHRGAARRGRRRLPTGMHAALSRRHLHGPNRGDCRQAQNAHTHVDFPRPGLC